ncbi:MAG TPA: glycosyltransferase family 2 protein [Verrucomicrobiae bacterium]|nr:glycosyltransferase family 2 protein [Verrucomicrobiae bacterium]
MSLDTPVALIIFNRPEKVKGALQSIAAARPRQLFVIADGPRSSQPEDVAKCAAARAVIERVDWPCEVVKGYSDVNLGCGRRPSTGISWVFEQVEEAIILEDDCVPDPTFFPYCLELLQRYRHDERVMMVAGRNRFRMATPYSYCFCRNHSNWGWACWRRAWQHFDIGIKSWPKLRETSWLEETLGRPGAVQFWSDIFDRAYAADGQGDYWDYQWSFAMWANNGLAAVPKVNLVRNMGFDEEATHTTAGADERASVPSGEMPFPLRHPPVVAQNKEYDDFVCDRVFPLRGPENLYTKIRRKLLATVGVYY